MQGAKPEGRAQAEAWQQAAQAWRRRMAQRFPAYRDVLGPVALALLEVQRGLNTMLAASEAGSASQQAAAQLMLYPPLAGWPGS